jgi:hypothetical protein
VTRRPVYFIAPFAHEAVFWAERWGYRKHEVRIVTRPTELQGISSDATVYIAGRYWMIGGLADLQAYLAAHRIECIYADSLEERA